MYCPSLEPVWQGSIGGSTSGSSRSPAKHSNLHQHRVWSCPWSPSRLPPRRRSHKAPTVARRSIGEGVEDTVTEPREPLELRCCAPPCHRRATTSSNFGGARVGRAYYSIFLCLLPLLLPQLVILCTRVLFHFPHQLRCRLRRSLGQAIPKRATKKPLLGRVGDGALSQPAGLALGIHEQMPESDWIIVVP
jgi:hypothetical protein